MSDEDQREEQQITEARERDERAILWHDITNFLGRVSKSGSEDIASSARALLERVHVL
jgi:hypothetical protein